MGSDILARALLDTVVGEKAHEGEVLTTMKGTELSGMAYEPLYRFEGITDRREKAWYVITDDYVTLTDGTGIVHIAPAFGEDDARVGREIRSALCAAGGYARAVRGRHRPGRAWSSKRSIP